MSDYHVLETEPNFTRIRVAMHIPVPNELNGAGTANLRAALVESKPPTTPATEVPWTLDVAEVQAFVDGALIEKVVDVKLPPNLTNPQRLAALDAAYTRTVTETVENLRRRLWAWRFERNVP